MTTVAATKSQIAADKQVTHASGLKFKSPCKLFTFDNPAIYKTPFILGLSGDLDVALELLEFFYSPEDFKLHKNYRSAEFLVLTYDQKLFTFADPRKWVPVGDRFYAIGSGSHFAMGAMGFGATPEEAVRVATKLDRGSGFGVSKIDVEKGKGP